VSYLKLVVTGLLRQRVRTGLTVASLAIAFLLLGLLQPVQDLFTYRSSLAGADRLAVLPKHSIADFLPVRAASRIRELPGVRGVAHQTWFGGTFRDPRNVFARWAVPPAEFLAMHPEIVLDVRQHQAFVATRTGAIVGCATARKYALKIGDVIPLIPDIWGNKSGAHWEFQLVGIFELENAPGTSTDMYVHYEYFDEARVWGHDLVSFVTVALDDPSSADGIARKIDALFANSDAETRTASEQEYALTFASQIGDVGMIVAGILAAVFFTIAMLTANTMAQAIRERTAELAVLRTLGFQRGRVFVLVLAEALLITACGAVSGLMLAKALIGSLASISAQLAAARVSASTLVWTFILAVAIALLAGIPPAWRASRLRIVDALRSY
jgi:putative ABC transport system permease protein